MTAQHDGQPAREFGIRFAVWLIIFVTLAVVWKLTIDASPFLGSIIAALTAGAINDVIVRIQRRRSRGT